MGITKAEQITFDDLTAEQKEAISATLGCFGAISAVTVTRQYEAPTPEDFLWTREETEAFWAKFQEEASPLAQYLLDHQSEFEEVAGSIFEYSCLQFLLDKQKVVDDLTYAQMPSMFSDWAPLLQDVQSDNLECVLKAHELYHVFRKYNKLVELIYQRAQFTDKKYGLFESCVFESYT